jgi:hypothetical protein
MINRISNNRKTGMTNIVNAALLAVGILLAAGCTSADAGFRAGLIAPPTTVHQSSTQEDDDSYVPPRSPGYDPLLRG